MEISQVPLGCEFRPSDEQLIQKFLLPKKKNEPLPCPCIVMEFDQFGSMHPFQIWDMYNGSPDGKTDLYFFVKSNQSNSRAIQADGSCGTWKNEGKHDVCNKDNQTIGIKRRFSYKNPELPGENCGWIMFEYSLEVKNSVSSYVICRLRKKGGKKNESTSRKRKSQTQSEYQAQVQHSAAVQLLVPPNSQQEEDVENYGAIWVAKFLENLQNSGSTSHWPDQSLHSDNFSSPPREDLPLIPSSESQQEEDVENYGAIWVAKFLENLQNSGSTSHWPDQSLHSDNFSSPPREDLPLIPSSESFVANLSSFPDPQSPSYRI